MRGRPWLSVLGVLVLFAIGLSYLLVAVVRFDPFADPMRMTVHLPRSGGLLDRSEVTYRGFGVGRVTDIALRPDGVTVRVRVDADTRIPADTDVVVARLSAAGEQYLDFRPHTDTGPYLTDGAVIEARDTSTPVPFSQVLASVSDLAAQVDPATLTTVVDELEAAFAGSASDLVRILEGGDVLLAGLEDVLPETVRVVRNGRVVLGTVSDLRDELTRFASSGRTLSAALREADPEIRDLLDSAPGALDVIDDLVADNKPTLAALLGDLVTVSEVVAARSPAIGVFLPELARLGERGALIVRDGKIQTIVDGYPRPTCDYGTPRRAPTIGGSPPPRLFRYCEQTGPRLQQRGSANVPRPPGDDTAGPPN